MTEVQKHGFIWEKDILCGAYGCPEEELKGIGYTSPHDLPSALNKVNGANLSLKCRKAGGEICMGNPLRVFDAVSSGEELHMVLIDWTQASATTKRLANLVEVNLTGAKAELFGTATREQVAELDALVKQIPTKSKPTEEQHQAIYALRNRLDGQMGAMKLRIKCNSQQSRVQCAFPNKAFTSFLKAHPGRIVATMAGGLFYGKPVLMEILSGCRVF